MSGAGTEMRQPAGGKRSGSRRGGRPARAVRLAGTALGALALPLGLSAAEAPPAGAAVHHAAAAAGPLAATASGSFHRRDGGIGVRPWLWVGGSLAVTGGLLVVVDTRRRRLH